MKMFTFVDQLYSFNHFKVWKHLLGSKGEHRILSIPSELQNFWWKTQELKISGCRFGYFKFFPTDKVLWVWVSKILVDHKKFVGLGVWNFNWKDFCLKFGPKVRKWCYCRMWRPHWTDIITVSNVITKNDIIINNIFQTFLEFLNTDFLLNFE
jgi:hypothetical protein